MASHYSRFENLLVTRGAASRTVTTAQGVHDAESPHVYAGQELTIGTTFIMAAPPAYDPADRHEERVITRIADHVYAGLEYVPGTAKVELVRSGVVTGLVRTVQDVVPELGDGTVSVTAPEGGWHVYSTSKNGSHYDSQTVNFTAKYRVPDNVPDGTRYPTGITFEVDGHEGSVGWPRLDWDVVVGAPPDPTSTGSADLTFGSSSG
ncbi:hypothetical protein ACWDUM_08710 [Rhodococcus sp. NPDC003322]